jgi:thiamine pyrophosphokinase
MEKTVILCNGAFPKHQIPLSILRNASRIICCDGAAESLLEKENIEPTYIVGDLDSLCNELKIRYKDRIHYDNNQNNNDLTKSVNFCIKNMWTDITIVGATGKREDHTIGNISLLTEYDQAKVQMITDFGIFVPIYKSTEFKSFAGQQISIFSLTPDTVFTFHGLKYPLDQQTITSWWQGTLNEAINDTFFIEMTEGKALVFLEFR